MTAATAKRSSEGGRVPSADFRAALEQALELAAADEQIGARLEATRLRMRFEFPDADLILNVSAGEQTLIWSFGDVPWEPQVEISMDSATANRYLQGNESLAIAIAHRQARFRGKARSALLYLPATRLLCEPYRRVVEAGFPSLRAA